LKGEIHPWKWIAFAGGIVLVGVLVDQRAKIWNALSSEEVIEVEEFQGGEEVEKKIVTQCDLVGERLDLYRGGVQNLKDDWISKKVAFRRNMGSMSQDVVDKELALEEEREAKYEGFKLLLNGLYEKHNDRMKDFYLNKCDTTPSENCRDIEWKAESACKQTLVEFDGAVGLNVKDF